MLPTIPPLFVRMRNTNFLFAAAWLAGTIERNAIAVVAKKVLRCMASPSSRADFAVRQRLSEFFDSLRGHVRSGQGKSLQRRSGQMPQPLVGDGGAGEIQNLERRQPAQPPQPVIADGRIAEVE